MRTPLAPPPHPISPATASLPLSGTQEVGSELRKSSSHSLWAAFIHCRVIRLYFFHLSPPATSIHPSRRLAHKFIAYCGRYIRNEVICQSTKCLFGSKIYCFSIIIFIYFVDVGVGCKQKARGARRVGVENL